MKKLFLPIILVFFGGNLFSQNFDIDLLKKINLNRNTSLDGGFQAITQSSKIIGVITPSLIYSIGYLKKDSSLKCKGLLIGESLLINVFLTTAIKYSINRERPFVTYPFIEHQTQSSSPSLPSMHTSIAFSTATSLSMVFPKWYVIAPSFLWAGSVAYSRLHLGAHYPTDIFAGALTGAGSAYLSVKLNKWLFK